MRILKTVFTIAGCAFFFALPLRAQSRVTKCDRSLGLADMGHTPSKGRLQEAGAPQTRHIVALGKNAIPLLIACLRDETETKESVVDFWPSTAVGDIAFFYLCDLFTDSTWEHSTIDGVVTWKTVEAEYPGSPSWTAWYKFVEKHGRRYVQNAWTKKWKKYESAIFWDEKEQCFKIGRPATQGNVRP
jgi:hypothetical protein